jgi:hypothetical protein
MIGPLPGIGSLQHTQGSPYDKSAPRSTGNKPHSVHQVQRAPMLCIRAKQRVDGGLQLVPDGVDEAVQVLRQSTSSHVNDPRVQHVLLMTEAVR